MTDFAEEWAAQNPRPEWDDPGHWERARPEHKPPEQKKEEDDD